MTISEMLLILMITCSDFGPVKSSAIFCSVCEVKPLPDFQNKRVSEGVLWTKTDMTSRAECAARCSLFRVIKSFGYKEASEECVAHTVPLTTPAAMTYASESGFNMYSTCAPVDGGVSAWAQWTGPACPQTCGPSHTIMKTRIRTCTNPVPDKGGANCTESLSETGDVSCGLPECPIDGGVSAWGAWGTLVCSQTCGTTATGTRTRTRTCTNPAPAYGGADCSETLSSTTSENCGFSSCQVDGGVSAWGAWGTLLCSQTCGTTATGTRTRTRTCTNPAPAYGGADCSETLSSTTSENCGFSSCPVDGGVSAWGAWGTLVCSLTCGTTATGTRTRTRTCNNPAPAYGGADCSETLSSTTSENCGFSSCPVNGGISSWGSWSGSCSQTCGPTLTVTKTRTRTCTNPTPSNGGSDCTESRTQTSNVNCGLPSCTSPPPHFGTCSSTCSGTNVVCNNGYCVCSIMYVKLGSSCVQDCGGSGYGSGFTIFHDKVLNGYNDRTVDSIQTIDACISLCQAESGFTCITADYQHQSKTCYLSKTAWYDASASSAVSSTTYHQVIRNCA
ncbi:coadhesin-like [Haliotis rufescens]|uniref:coadhesin-like n=1 Tax=Haliotis rufescens TaxID=6454 RepID=UPI00201EFBFB|nr:coadhesin-like [Haliotis rufescens]